MTVLNLLPWRERRRQRRRRVFVVGMAWSFAAAAAVLGLAWHVTDVAIELAREENARLAEQLAGLDSRLQELAAIERSNAEMAGRITTLRRLDAARLDTVRVFDELARTLPPGLRYTALARRGGVVSVRGTTDAEASVSTFMRNLARSPWFGAPSLQNIGDAADPGGSAMFDLSFAVASPPDGTAPPEPAYARE